MTLPNYIPFGMRQAVSKRWHDAKARKRMLREPDFETLRKRALDDARGTVLREGCTFSASGETHWHTRCSVAWRSSSDQLDLVANGEVVRTCGARRLPKRFR